MKKYVCTSNRGACIDTVDGVNIYWDESTAQCYIYTQPHGQGRVEFESPAEAASWVRENLGDTYSITASTYIVTVGDLVDYEIDADSDEEAFQYVCDNYLDEDDLEELDADPSYVWVRRVGED